LVAEGETLDGTYRLDRVIGAGGMGIVYEATHARLAGRYAIKVLLRELSDRPEIRARFVREAHITSALQHPNIVQVIDTNSTADGTSYMVMELLSGESLAERLARVGPLAAPAVVDVVDQIAAGLAAAHARGVIHRDLKPDNVILVPVEGRPTELVKILDFGISKVRGSRETTDPGICGTPQYMAPEQVEGRASDVDAGSDQYALAVIAYELLTGKNPFAAESIQEIFTRVKGGVVPPTGVAGGAVDPVLMRAMRGDGCLRFPSVTAFAEAFREAALAVRSPTVPLSPPAGAGPARREGGRLRHGFAAAAAIAITSFLGTGAANRAPTSGAAAGVAAPARATATAVAPANTVASEAIEKPVRVPVTIATSSSEAPAPAEAGEDRAPPARPRRARVIRPVAAKSRPALPPDEDATLPPSDL
jgi:serine/threonine-protein kinase